MTELYKIQIRKTTTEEMIDIFLCYDSYGDKSHGRTGSGKQVHNGWVVSIKKIELSEKKIATKEAKIDKEFQNILAAKELLKNNLHFENKEVEIDNSVIYNITDSEKRSEYITRKRFSLEEGKDMYLVEEDRFFTFTKSRSGKTENWSFSEDLDIEVPVKKDSIRFYLKYFSKSDLKNHEFYLDLVEELIDNDGIELEETTL